MLQRPAAGVPGRWFRRLRQVAIPEDRTRWLLGMGGAALLGPLQGVGWPGGVAAGLAKLLGGSFVALRAASAQARHPPAVAEGQQIPWFEAPDAAPALRRRSA